jgi:hypothetical protein
MSNDLLYATTDDGMNLPVIDVTHPAFAVSPTEAGLAAMAEQYLAESSDREQRLNAIRDTLSRTMLGRALMSASGSYLNGLDTYMFKLGPDNLGAEAHPLDRRIAASFPALTARMRLQDMARLLAEGLAPRLAAEPRRPVQFINIAGGPAADSWNTVLHLARRDATLVRERKILISVFDRDERGPHFGARAVAALGAAGAPLNGLEISFLYFQYDWAAADGLRQSLEDLRAHDAVCAVSSEGGLFDYGSDEEIVANLAALRQATASDAILAGSVTRDCELVRSSRRPGGVATRPRTLEAFRSLAEQGGWAVDNVVERPFSFNLRLARL